MLKLHLNGATREIPLPGGAVLRLRAQMPVDIQIAREFALNVSKDAPEDERSVHLRAAFASAFLKRIVESWEGIGDMAGNPIEPSSEAIDHLLMVPKIYDIIETEVVWPVFMRLDEKNGSPPSAVGTSPATSQGAGEKVAAGRIAKTVRATGRSARTP